MKMTRHSRRGMTLIELLVVTIIIGLLMSLGLSVGSSLLTRADRRHTISTMAVVMGAIDAYYEQCGAYPPQENAAKRDGDGNIVMSGEKVVMLDPAPDPPGTDDYSDFLLLMLKTCPASLKALSDLDQQAMNEGAECDYAFIDGFNLPIRYNAIGGFGGTPKLSSAGPDGKYDNDDDITSGSK